MNRKLVSALKKEFLLRLSEQLPSFTICPDGSIDKKMYMNGMEAYCAKLGKRYVYVITVPYIKSFNEFGVDLYFSPEKDRVEYYSPSDSFAVERHYKKNGTVPDDVPRCGIDLNHFIKENNLPIRYNNLWRVDITQDELSDKEKIRVAIVKAVNELMSDLIKYGLPFLYSL